MSDPILKFAEFFRAKLLAVPELASVVGTRIYNSFAPPRAKLPFAVFTVIPLEDRTGQGRASIQTRLLCDFRIETPVPFDARALGEATSAVTETFRTARTAHDYDEFRISVWGVRPISRMSSGAQSAERIYSFGKTFQATISRVPTPAFEQFYLMFLLSSGTAVPVALTENEKIVFLSKDGSNANIALNDDKIEFTTHAGDTELIPLYTPPG